MRILLTLLTILMCSAYAQEEAIERWLGPQQWQRDSEVPVLTLGASGNFDDRHIFAPCVALEAGKYSLWYCGSRGEVANRVFQMGMATSEDGYRFARKPDPVYAFGDGKHSILTPTLLRSPEGAVLRENGQLRMWFASTDFTDPESGHLLHETHSQDGIHWEKPSKPQLSNVYAPTIIKEKGAYRMWYSDVSADPWIIRHAHSEDGISWQVTETPCVVVDQAWERDRLFYPTVVKADGIYVMWYGAYWTKRPQTTAIGSAVSTDGLSWQKNPHNPVLRPNPNRPWESHYTTSQSVMRLEDGVWRIWYATRKAPPFENKYFAIGTASWLGPDRKQ